MKAILLVDSKNMKLSFEHMIDYAKLVEYQTRRVVLVCTLFKTHETIKYCMYNLQVVIGVPAIYLAYVRSIIPDNVAVSAQNCWKVAKGAFTGYC